ncbi:L-alanine exporter AlaE [Psychromonas aquimarina]|uniref:L-alanine exporter AlaE n=1 Tax=Psychromonas aquimarina TaxID=444919 RepID=UPI000687E3AD|nr:L-alanine exporter AlaE [Psychromonas aquimarina]
MKINSLWLADTLALMSFTIITGIFIEVLIVGMTIQQSLLSRLLCQPVNIVTGRMYGIYRDKIIGKLNSAKLHKRYKVLGDITAYITFQLPLYILILFIIGMDIQNITKAAMAQTLALLVLGAPYGYWLTAVRKFMNAASDPALRITG